MPSLSRVFTRAACCVLLTQLAPPVAAAPPLPSVHRHDSTDNLRAAPGPFIATTAMPFAELMDNAMDVMNHGMAGARMNGDPDHDFAAMMIPHHQGAVDMAKAQLLYGKNPVLRRLAQEIIISQCAEIAVMRAELDKRKAVRATPPARPATP